MWSGELSVQPVSGNSMGEGGLLWGIEDAQITCFAINRDFGRPFDGSAIPPFKSVGALYPANVV